MNNDLPDLPTEFTSERLLLRRYRSSDSATYYQMLRNNLEHLYEFLPSFLMDVRGEEDVKTWFDRQNAEWDARNLFIFGAWEKGTDHYVGECYLANPDWDVPRIEVEYFLVRNNTGKGYATEAAQAAIRYAFEQMGVLRIDLRCAADNAASIRVTERCGFTQEGCFRQNHRVVGELFRIVRKEGLVVIACPDKRYTFDQGRKLTGFEHLQREYEAGVADVTDEHYLDFLAGVHPEVMTAPPEVLSQHVAHVRRRREHAHVWDSASFRHFLERSLALLGIGATCVFEARGDQNEFEYFSVWKKGSEPSAPLN